MRNLVLHLMTNGQRHQCHSLLRSNHVVRTIPSILSRPLTTSNQNERVLYQRAPDTYLQPRAAISLSWLSCVYSTWYNFDFIPSVNNSGIPELFVNPMVGTAGCTITYLLAGLGCLYARQVVSKITIVEGSIHVYRHNLPFVYPSGKSTEYKMEQISVDYSSDDVKQLMELLESGKADMTGYIPLTIENHRLPLAIYLSTIRDIQDQTLFVDALFYKTLTKSKERKPRKMQKPRQRRQPSPKNRNPKLLKRK